MGEGVAQPEAGFSDEDRRRSASHGLGRVMRRDIEVPTLPEKVADLFRAYRINFVCDPGYITGEGQGCHSFFTIIATSPTSWTRKGYRSLAAGCPGRT